MSQGPYRYAKALLELASESEAKTSALAEVRDFAELLLQDADLASVLKRPLISRSKKLAIVEDLAKLAAWSTLTVRFLSTLVENGRVVWLSAICEALDQLEKKQQHIVSACFTSAQPLSATSKSHVEKTLRAVLHADVDVCFKAQPDLLGGYSVQVGSYLVDHSAQTKLAKLQKVIEGTA